MPASTKSVLSSLREAAVSRDHFGCQALFSIAANEIEQLEKITAPRIPSGLCDLLIASMRTTPLRRFWKIRTGIPASTPTYLVVAPSQEEALLLVLMTERAAGVVDEIEALSIELEIQPEIARTKKVRVDTGASESLADQDNGFIASSEW